MVAWDVLAGLRFALAAIVLCSHVSFYFPSADLLICSIGALGGKAAVTGFLLVSGYSIAASINRQPGGFYRRRLLRIYPLYLAAVLFAVALEWHLHGSAIMPSGAVIEGTGLAVALGNLIFLQTFRVKPIAFNGPLWSLAVEVSYYLTAPVLRRIWRPLLWAALLISAAAFVSPRRDDLGPLYFVFTRLNALTFAWAWIAGFVLYGTKNRYLIVGLGLFGTALTWLNDQVMEPLAPLTFAVSFAVVVASTSGKLTIPRRISDALNYLGDLSYPLYLFHFPALIAAASVGLTQAYFAVALAVALSMAALYLIDVRLKQAWLNRRPLAPQVS